MGSFGSSRKKLTTFLVRCYEQFHSLERFCPGDHEHEPWGFDETTATFNTAKEAEYPDGMCTGYADIFQTIISATGLRPEDFTAKSAATAPQAQKRGRLVLEFLWTKTVLLQNTPDVDHKKCLVDDCGHIPAGCKLLRTEANKGKDGQMTMCVFGCYRSMQQFVDVSKQLWHPYDELKNLPDAIVKNLFWYITSSPSTDSKQRLECLTKWMCLQRKLASLEHQLHEQMSTTVGEVLRAKNVLLMRQIAEKMQWPDQTLFDEMVEGFRLTGNFPAWPFQASGEHFLSPCRRA